MTLPPIRGLLVPALADLPETTQTAPLLSVVIPCYNEAENLSPLLDRLLPVLKKSCGERFEILFVDDGSRDGSEETLDVISTKNPRIRVLHFSRNFGHQAALLAGLDAARGDAVVLMDADLQDPPELIETFVARWREGYDVAYAQRATREEGLAKRAAYALFYRSMRAISAIDVPLDAGDFSLLDRRVVEALRSFSEQSPFLRGLRAWVGFRQIAVPYERPARERGHPKYTLRKLVRLALSGYIGFSQLPLRAAVGLGFFFAVVGFCFAAWAVLSKILGVPTPWGWASTLAVIMTLGGVQLLVLGIMGEYLGRVLDEVRGRPRYVLREKRRG